MRKDLRAEQKAKKRAIKDATTKADKAKAKQAYKDFKNAGRTKGQKALDFWFANSTDVRAYMNAGMSHTEAFKRSFGDNMLTSGIIATASSIGQTIVKREFGIG